ncbi:MAG: 2-dehydropantoate 2-reductase [Candidatus Omnitrophica bacterium]|nr:2-dehydropantoate 2-reductase [Candidatus Omnitrophota bacterium]
MKIAVIGAGAIGNLVAGYLKLAGQDASLVGRRSVVKEIQANGLRISGVRGDFKVAIPAAEKLLFAPELVILATKTQDIAAALKDNLALAKGAAILTTQNGVAADKIVAGFVDKEDIISSIVMFGATSLEPAKVVHNFEGSWIISAPLPGNAAEAGKIKDVLNKVFPVKVCGKILGMKYLKIFVNANNCIPAILGISMQEAFGDINTSRVSIAIWKEGLEIIRRSAIELESLPDFPLERLVKLSSLPAQEAAQVFSGIMLNLSKVPLYGSILQSIKRKRPSEIDYINGEFVGLAARQGLRAPLNEKLVEMVHQVEATSRFFTREELLANTEELLR